MISETLSGFSTEEERAEKIDRLRAAYSVGYGFYLRAQGQHPAGDYWFTYSRGSSAD